MEADLFLAFRQLGGALGNFTHTGSLPDPAFSGTILGYLKSYRQDDPMAPISYYEFVIDPNSFSRTVENIFHTSFLVRDGLAQVYLDDDKLPCIAPVEEGEEGEVGDGESSSQNQWIVYQPQNVEGAHSSLRHHRRNDSASKHRMSDGPRHVSLAETEQCF